MGQKATKEKRMEHYLDNNTLSIADLQTLKITETMLSTPAISHRGKTELAQKHRALLNETIEKIVNTIQAPQEAKMLFENDLQTLHRRLFESLYRHRILEEQKSKIIIYGRESVGIQSAALALKRRGIEVLRIGCDAQGAFDLDAFKASLDDTVAWVSISHADAFSGVLLPIEEITTLLHEMQIPFHSDASTALGKIPIDMQRLGIDYLTLDAHAAYAPQAAAVLCIKANDPLTKTLFVDAYGFVGFDAQAADIATVAALGKAVEIASDMLGFETEEMRDLRDTFESRLEEIGGVTIVGKTHARLANTLAFQIDSVSNATAMHYFEASDLLLADALTERLHNPYIQAIGNDEKLRHTLLSIALSPDNDEACVESVIETIEEKIKPTAYKD